MPASWLPSDRWPTPIPAHSGTNIDVNVLGVMHGTAAFARHVRSRAGSGVLVNLSSGAATRPYDGWAAYCGSKAAVEMITEVVAREERSLRAVGLRLVPGPGRHRDAGAHPIHSPEAFPAGDRSVRCMTTTGSTRRRG